LDFESLVEEKRPGGSKIVHDDAHMIDALDLHVATRPPPLYYTGEKWESKGMCPGRTYINSGRVERRKEAGIRNGEQEERHGKRRERTNN
jgi:hypothetical protein